MESYFNSEQNTSNIDASDSSYEDIYSGIEMKDSDEDDIAFIIIDDDPTHPSNLSNKVDSSPPPSPPNVPPDKQNDSSSSDSPHDNRSPPSKGGTSPTEGELNDGSPPNVPPHQIPDVKPPIGCPIFQCILMPNPGMVIPNFPPCVCPVSYPPQFFYGIPNASPSMNNCSALSFGCNACLFQRVSHSICDQINNANQLKMYLQKIISGRSETRFNKDTLHHLYKLLAKMFGWGELTRSEKRNKQLVFQRLYENKLQVIECIQNCPFIIEQVLVKRGINKMEKQKKQKIQ